MVFVQKNMGSKPVVSMRHTLNVSNDTYSLKNKSSGYNNFSNPTFLVIAKLAALP